MVIVDVEESVTVDAVLVVMIWMELPEVYVAVTGHQVVVAHVMTVTVSSGVRVELAGTVTGITETGTPGVVSAVVVSAVVVSAVVVSAVVVSVTVFVCSGTLGIELALTPVGGVTITVEVAGIVDVEVTTTTEGVLDTVV